MPSHPFRILRTNDLAELLGISRTTLWRWERRGLLPAKRQLGPNCIGWLESEIESWLEAKAPPDREAATAEVGP